VKLKKVTPIIYLCAAGGTAGFLLTQHLANAMLPRRGWFFFSYWLLLFAIPLLYAFAYPRYVFDASSGTRRQIFAIILNGLGAATTIFLFLRLALPYPDNPVRDVDSLVLPLFVLIIALPVFIIAAFFLWVKSRSSLAMLASILMWPYWLLLALAFLDRWFDGSPLHKVCCFLCFLSPVLLAFAAGSVVYRSALAHSSAAFAGLMSMPWIYRSEFGNRWIVNSWIALNVPDRELAWYPPLQVWLTILTVALVVLAGATAALRSLPQQWKIGKWKLCDWTWPAFVTTFAVLAVWFRLSVLPYRIPGALDYGQYPVFQVLHVEKHGLQFHETCVSVYRLGHFSVSRNDRRLFQYRFEEKSAEGLLPDPLMQRVNATVQASVTARRKWDTITPLRAWNADGWYFLEERSGLRSYTTQKGTAPPRDIVALFHDIAAAPRSYQTQRDRKDVCLGFCYDPLAGLGYLYANHRCFNGSSGFVCR
jgi:hypothetical protein